MKYVRTWKLRMRLVGHAAVFTEDVGNKFVTKAWREIPLEA
jgi:hypothetical protein